MERTEFELKPFHSTADAGWDEIMAIYAQSFPLPEQWPVEGYRRALGDPLFRADGIWVDGRPAGLLFHWRDPAYRYLEHLAVSPAVKRAGSFWRSIPRRMKFRFADRDSTSATAS